MGLFNKANNFLANEDEVLLVGEQNDQKNEKTPSDETKIFHQNKLFPKLLHLASKEFQVFHHNNLN